MARSRGARALTGDRVRRCTIGTGGRRRSGDVRGLPDSPTVRVTHPGAPMPGRSAARGAAEARWTRLDSAGSPGRLDPTSRLFMAGTSGSMTGLAVHAAPRRRDGRARAARRAGRGARHRCPSRSRSGCSAAGFYLAEAKVIHLHIGRSAHSFSMSEIPLVAGLFLVSPPAFIVARVVGLRARPRLQSSPALGQARVQPRPVQPRLGRLGRHHPRRRAAGRAARSGPALWVAVLAGGARRERHRRAQRQHRDLAGRGDRPVPADPRDAQDRDRRVADEREPRAHGPDRPVGKPGSVWLFVLPTVTAALAYRAYISERQQHESIELLYESTRILQRSPELDTAHHLAARARPEDVPGRRRRDPSAAAPGGRRGPALPGRARATRSWSWSRSGRRWTTRSWSAP